MVLLCLSQCIALSLSPAGDQQQQHNIFLIKRHCNWFCKCSVSCKEILDNSLVITPIHHLGSCHRCRRAVALPRHAIHPCLQRTVLLWMAACIGRALCCAPRALFSGINLRDSLGYHATSKQKTFNKMNMISLSDWLTIPLSIQWTTTKYVHVGCCVVGYKSRHLIK